jgi:hypothetical protein
MPPVWTDLAGAAALVKDRDLVALAGHTRAAPMALIRELIRQGPGGLGGLPENPRLSGRKNRHPPLSQGATENVGCARAHHLVFGGTGVPPVQFGAQRAPYI